MFLYFSFVIQLVILLPKYHYYMYLNHFKTITKIRNFIEMLLFILGVKLWELRAGLLQYEDHKK